MPQGYHPTLVDSQQVKLVEIQRSPALQYGYSLLRRFKARQQLERISFLTFKNYIYLFTQAHDMVHIWWSQDNLKELVFSTIQASGDLIHVIRLITKCLYPVSHLASENICFSKLKLHGVQMIDSLLSVILARVSRVEVLPLSLPFPYEGQFTLLLSYFLSPEISFLSLY